MEYLYELRLVNENGQTKKSIFLNVYFLNHFKPSEDRQANNEFCNKYLSDWFKECKAYFKGLKGYLSLAILDIKTGNYIAGSDLIGG